MMTQTVPVNCVPFGTRQDWSGYNTEIAQFTDYFLEHADSAFGMYIKDYRSWLAGARHGSTLSREQAALEFLTLGVLWKTCSMRAIANQPCAAWLLKALVDMKTPANGQKTSLDFVRGFMINLFLSVHDHANAPAARPTPANLDRLLAWLAKTGEYDREAKGLRQWRLFLMSLRKRYSMELLDAADRLADWFDHASRAVLGKYASSADLRNRQRIEFHLSMTEAEIVSRMRKGTAIAAQAA